MSRIPMLMQVGLLACCAAVTPVMAQGVAPDQSAPPPGFAEQSPGGAQPQENAKSGAGRFVERFRGANTTGDGHLTLAQAEAAHMPMIVRNFATIDTQHNGYITLRDIRAWRQEMRAERDSTNGSRD